MASQSAAGSAPQELINSIQIQYPEISIRDYNIYNI